MPFRAAGQEDGMDKGRKAWLVEWCSPTGKEPRRPIAAVLSPRFGGEAVRVRVEAIYAAAAFAPSEMLDHLVRPSNNPYPAKFSFIEISDPSGDIRRGPWEGQIFAGHNPYLFARMVTNLRIGDGQYDDGSPRLEWEEIAVPGRSHEKGTPRAD
jgi:hypothetical protein